MKWWVEIFPGADHAFECKVSYLQNDEVFMERISAEEMVDIFKFVQERIEKAAQCIN